MEIPGLQREYWNRVGPGKPFSHPVNIEKLKRWVPLSRRILDYGCGYGRTTGLLRAHGYTDLLGLDPAPEMIAAAQEKFPSIRFEVMADYSRIDVPEKSVDAVMLFTVLTSVPADSAQSAIISEIGRVLRPGGLLYISDMLLQNDERNLRRYAEGEKKYSAYGVFDLEDGVTVRHHKREWIDRLIDGYDVLEFDEIEIRTMNGNPGRAFQCFGRKPGGILKE